MESSNAHSSPAPPIPHAASASDPTIPRARPGLQGRRGRGRGQRGRATPVPPTPLRAPAPAGPRLLALALRLLGCARRSASLRAMARLLSLLGPAGRVGARIRPRATWVPGATAPCSPSPLFLPLLRTGPGVRFLSAPRGDRGGLRVSLPNPTLVRGRDPRSEIAKGELCTHSFLTPSTFSVPRPHISTGQRSDPSN